MFASSKMFADPTSINKIQKALVNQGSRKRLLVYGPPGTSKTYTMNKLLEDNNYKLSVLDAVEVKQNKEELTKYISKCLNTAGLGDFVDWRHCLIIDNVRGDYVRQDGPEKDRDTRMVIEVITSYLESNTTGKHVPLIIIADCIVSKEMKKLAALMVSETVCFPW
jgi:Cdc6-like AAA superfamily ATPase